MAFAAGRQPDMTVKTKGQFLHGTELTAAICATLAGDRKDIAVAFWGAEPLKRLGITDASQIRVACDLYSGACNPSAIKDLLDGGASVFDVPGLHAKVYLGSTAMVVGSANVSANGLGEEGVEVVDGLEAGLNSDRAVDLTQADDWFKKLLSGRAPVGPEVLSELTRLWNFRRRGRPKRSTGSLLDAMVGHDPILRDRAFKMVVYVAEEPSSKVKKAYKAYDPTPIKRGNPYPYFFYARGWKLRKDDLLLCFEVEGKSLSYEAVWRVRDVLDRGDLVPLALEKQPLGLKLTGKDCRLLTKQVRGLLAQGVLTDAMAPITIESFVDLIAPSARVAPAA